MLLSRARHFVPMGAHLVYMGAHGHKMSGSAPLITVCKISPYDRGEPAVSYK